MKTEVINIKELYESQVLELWYKYENLPVLTQEGFEYRKFPLLPLTLTKGGILFVGINPSYSQQNNCLPTEKVSFYSNPTSNLKDIQYFERFKEISNYCNNYEWNHLDLLFIRETNQNIIKDLLYDKQGIEFISEQLRISFEIINCVQPQIIVVSNALVAEFFGKKKREHENKFKKIWLGYDLDFDKDFDKTIGTYKIPVGNKETPIIFSSMLSGQRALDIGSFERLKWQIKKILTTNE
mgnify:CR=1 FL=1